MAEAVSSSVMDGFSNLPVLRQIGLMIGLAASVAVGFGIVLWSQEPDYRPISTDLSHLDANQVTQILSSEQIAYRIDTDSGVLMVDATRIHDARMKLAASGITLGQGVGYELLDKDSGLGTSQFMEKALYQRSIEGELARTIRSLRPVKAARVHLALPKRSVFITDKRQARASVFVDLYPGSSLSKGQVASIVHLVASSVPELNSKMITVVDQQGKLLTETDGETDIARASKQYEYIRNIEKKYVSSVANILAPLVGEDAFKVEVNADIDFTRQEQTSEQFNPDLPAIRSEKVYEEQRGSGDGPGGVPGATANQPPAVGRAPEVQVGDAEGGGNAEGVQNRRRRAVTQYELDRTISYTQHQVGRVQRLSVAVLLDHLNLPQADGGEQSKDEEKSTMTKQPISPQMLESITQLVKDAVGYNPQRGDTVVVINQPFLSVTESIEPIEIEEKPFYEAHWFMPLVKKGIGWFIAAIIMLGVLRPILKNLSHMSASTASMELALPDVPSFDDADDSITQPEVLLPGPGESYEAQLNAVKSLVAEDPRRVAQVVKTWLNE